VTKRRRFVLEEKFEDHLQLLQRSVWGKHNTDSPVPAKKPPSPERRRELALALALKLISEGLAHEEGGSIYVRLQSGAFLKRLAAENPTEKSVAVCSERTLKRARLGSLPHIILAPGKPTKSSA
jgi:hypothetical protein